MRGLSQNINNCLQPVEVDLVESREHRRVEVKDSNSLVPLGRLQPQGQDNFGLCFSVAC